MVRKLKEEGRRRVCWVGPRLNCEGRWEADRSRAGQFAFALFNSHSHLSIRIRTSEFAFRGGGSLMHAEQFAFLCQFAFLNMKTHF